jgi:transcriptional regulator with PAS, ATPase and Fis domain
MRRLFLLLDRVGESGAPVLIHGESGTGKELVARAIHDVGPRRLGPFLSVNCAAMPETLLEAELFGHLKGAFTGAHEEKPGLFLAASGGTIFLDEIGETSPGMQAKLLRVLQEREVRPVGGSRVVKVDARVIAASNKDLARLVEAGLFRVDLFYRLNVIAVPVPPLRERREDIPLLLEHFLKAAAGSAGAPRREVGPGVLEALLRYPWPGNVRELENEVRRACALSGGRIELDDLSPPLRGERAPPPEEPPGDGAALTLEEQLEIAERRVLKEALLRVDGNKTRAAKELGLSRFGLLKKLDRYGLR